MSAEITSNDVASLRQLLQRTNDSLAKWLREQEFGDCQMQGAVVSQLAAALLSGQIANVGLSPRPAGSAP